MNVSVCLSKGQGISTTASTVFYKCTGDNYTSKKHV